MKKLLLGSGLILAATGAVAQLVMGRNARKLAS